MTNTETISPQSYAAQGKSLPGSHDALQAAARHAGPKLNHGLSRILQPASAVRWMTPQRSQMTPQYIEQILASALSGDHRSQAELFDLMEDTWPRLLKNTGELKQGVMSFDWPVEPWAEEDTPPTESAVERKRLVSGALWTMRSDPDMPDNGFQQTVFDILDAWFKGTSVLEVVDWIQKPNGSAGSMMGPKATAWVHPQFYGWHEEGWIGLANDGRDGRALERFPENKFLISICRARSGHPLAGALLRPLAFWWCVSNFSSSWLLNFAQIFGLPIRWANYDTNAPGVFEKVCEMLENMGSAAWGAFPEGTTLELKEPMKTGADNPQITLLDRADKQADLLIFGETTTSEIRDQGGAYAASKVGLSKRDQVIYSAAQFAAGIINAQFVPMILRMNYGEESEVPEFRPKREEIKDAKASAERDALLLGAGVEMPKKWFYARHGIPLPQAGEETISGRAPAAAGLPRFGQPSAGETPEDEKAKEEKAEKVLEKDLELTGRQSLKGAQAKIADALGVPASWLNPIEEHLANIQAKCADASLTDSDLIAFLAKAERRVPELFARMDLADLAEVLEAGMGAAVLDAVRKGVRHGETKAAR